MDSEAIVFVLQSSTLMSLALGVGADVGRAFGHRQSS